MISIFDIDCANTIEWKVTTAPSAFESPFESFRLKELGADVEYSVDGKTWKPIALPAMRLGVHSELDFKGKIWLKSSVVPTAPLSVEQLCSSQRSEVLWEIQIQNIAEASDFSVKAGLDQVRRWSAQLSGDYQKATAPYRRAAISHVLANQHWLLGDLHESRRWFEIAGDLWKKLENEDWQAAAQLGSIDLASRMNQLNADQLLKTHFPRFPGDAYYRLRLQEIGCLDQRNRGLIDLAQACMNSLVAGYSGIGESFEALNSRITQVYWLSESEASRVNIESFQELEAKLPDSPAASLYRGRYFLMLDYLYRLRGDFQAAIRSNLLAQRAFAVSTEESEMWLVNAKRMLAANLNRLGLYEHSLEILQVTLRRVDAKSYPARAVSVIDSLAQTFAQAGRLTAAIEWQEKALVLRETLGLKVDQAVSRQRLQKWDPSRAGYRLFNPALPKSSLTDEQLLEVELLILQGNIPEAQKNLSVLALLKLSSENQLKYAELVARGFMASGKPKQAAQALLQHFQKVAEQLNQEPSGALAFLKLRQQRALSRLWVDANFAEQTSAKSSIGQSANPLSAQAVWQFAMLQNASKQLTPQSSAASASRRVNTDFIDWLSQAALPPRVPALSAPSLEQFSASLPQDAAVFILLPGNKQSIGLWVTSAATQTVILSAATELEADVRALNTWLLRRGAIADFAAISARFKSWWPSNMPKRVWIIADEMTLTVPFAALLNDQRNLLEISYLTGLRKEPKQNDRQQPATGEPSGSSRVLFFAPNQAEGNAARLDFIDSELKSLAAFQLTSFVGNAATRENLQMALQRSGWTHISAHGVANKQSFGLAGIKLSGTDKVTGVDASVVSWLDLSQIQSRNELLVLNACDLASATEFGRQANVSFALAASTSGAKHTVAALWPVSDIASITWVPEFYRELRGNADLSAAALYQAQLKLYHSPHFQHPYFWASLVHFRQWNVAAQ